MTVEWLELCLDVDASGEDVAMAEFWAAALGCTYLPYLDEPGDPGNVVGPPGGGIAFCSVAEPKSVKHRVHLDVHTDAVETLVRLGATVAQELPGWTVLTDPQGGELCAFVRAEVPDYRLYEVVIDSSDAEASATWWATRFGVSAGHDDDHPWWWVEGVPGMAFESLVFAPVPEPKTVKNRIHWDVRGDVAELEAAGATVLWSQPDWVTMADPEGNEFCVFRPSAAG